MTSRRDADRSCGPRDSVDALQASWRARRADLDVTGLGVVSRLNRLRAHLDHELDAVFAAHGLSSPTFQVLVTLARIGDDRGVSQRRLADELDLTSGTVSVRTALLVNDGLIAIRPDPQSKRTTLITLTDRGRDLFERVAPAHLANEQRLLTALSTDERERLETLLRTLLVEFEGTHPPASTRVHLGLTLAPTHRTIALRAAMGLPPVAGLLTRSVADNSPAAHAGIRTGDVLCRAGSRTLRAVTALHAALQDATTSNQLAVQLLRGTRTLDVTVDLAPTQHPDGTRSAASANTVRGEHTI